MSHDGSRKRWRAELASGSGEYNGERNWRAEVASGILVTEIGERNWRAKLASEIGERRKR